MAQFKSFVSEIDLDERRKKRQEEWEKVRKADDPLEAPEEEYDPRSLYDQLQEQKNKKQAEYEEAHKLKNMIRGLDDDEVEFLDFVDRTKEEIEAKRWKEEIKELSEFRKAVATLAEKSADQRLEELKKEANVQLISSTGVKKSQASLLAGVVKRKSCDRRTSVEKKLRTEEPAKNEDANQSNINDSTLLTSTVVPERQGDNSEKKTAEKQTADPVATHYGVIPGLGAYSDSSDSENSSSSVTEQTFQYDLLGRRTKHADE